MGNARQAVDLGDDSGQILLSQLLAVVVHHRLRINANNRHRRSQLVANVGDEVLPHPLHSTQLGYLD